MSKIVEGYGIELGKVSPEYRTPFQYPCLGMSLSRPRASQARQCGVQQIQRDAQSNFPNKRRSDSAFRYPVRSRVEIFKFVRAGLGAGHQIVGIDEFVEETGV